MAVPLTEIWKSRGAARQQDELPHGCGGSIFRYPSGDNIYKYGPQFQERGGNCTYMGLEEMAKEKNTERQGTW